MKNTKRFLSIVVVFAIISLSAFAQRSTYKKIKIYGTQIQLNELIKQGVCMDHGDIKKNTWFISYFNEQETTLIKKSGLKYEILIENTKEFYKTQKATLKNAKVAVVGGCTNGNAPTYPMPSHFKLGSMGGFLTYSEMLSELDSMALLYPNLISVKQTVDTGFTWDSNVIYFVKISNNPNVSQSLPQVYYSALHHAREPLSMQQMIYYMWYLLENYQTDSLVKNLVNSREQYFVPCVNPDGYLYNELTDPTGGGLWRKNRRDNLDGTFGVDINRNYDLDWGLDNIGSSPFTNSETYRGISAASEPETQMIKHFINTHHFVTGLDYHTYGNRLIYPWDAIPNYYTPDSANYVNLGNAYTAYNLYLYGTSNQTINYVVNGGSVDWLYGEQISKPKIFDFTPECGYDFWPAQADIIPIIQGTVHMNVMSALVAGKYAKVEDTSPILLPSTTGYINFSLTQLGLDTLGSYTITLTPLSSNILATGNPKIIGSLKYLQIANDSILYTLASNLPNGTVVKFILTIDLGTYQLHDTLTKYFGTPVTLVSDNGTTMNQWATGTQWGTTTSSFYSAPSSITDSPFGNYLSNTFNPLVIAAPINLVAAIKAGLSFYTHWQIEAVNDYAEVAASDDNGVTWSPLCGRYTHAGALTQDPGMPIYDGLKANWVKEEMSLDDYLGKNILLRFLLVSDGATELDGFYFDDFKVWALSSNVGVDENKSTVFMSELFPNPANTNVSVNYSVPPGDHYQLQMVNAIGQNISLQTLDNAKSTTTVDLKNIEAGVYFFRIETAKNIFAVKRLVVIK